jgi:putative protease
MIFCFVELLAPAGDREKAKLAILYGADAVYLGGKFGLRAFAPVSLNDIKETVLYSHALGKKVYVTVNIFPRNADFEEITEYIKNLEKIGADAVIVSDLGVMRLVRENTKLDIHISTQANVLNTYTAEEYVRLGAKRIILARECALDEIKQIAKHLAGRCEIEVFVHGSMCVCYSGRCLLSNYLTHRESNRGECAQPCRWKYFLTEEKRPGQYMQITEDAHGAYIMNSKDLCLIGHLGELEKAGVTSVKIEGRMKSEYYVASAVSAYRRMLNGENFNYNEEINKVAHRPWTKGFVFNTDDSLYYESAASGSTYEVTAFCLGGNRISQRNVFSVGDELEILSPSLNNNKKFLIKTIKTQDGKNIIRANKAEEVLFIDCPYEICYGDFLRRKNP